MYFICMNRMVPYFLVWLLFLTGCALKPVASAGGAERDSYKPVREDPARIAEAESEYEIVVIEPGFYNWLKTYAQPEGFYTQAYMENRNSFYVQTWNQRVLLPGQYDPELYVLPIEYDPKINYGYDLNYKLFQFFLYFQQKYNQQLGPVPSRM